jgi:MYXO-CTERM domain-containing protein
VATWKAEVFVNSRVGRINTEVEAATFSGAKEQIYAKHGDVQQILNLRQVNSYRSSSSGDGDSSGGALLLIALFLLGVIVTYWYYAIPAIIILSILYYIGSRED